MVDIKRIVTYSLFAVVTISASMFMFCNIPEKKAEQHVEEKPNKCLEFAVLISEPNQKVECLLGFLETQETENGKILVICHCQDPLRCSSN